ncbi:nuclear transport factor 2 family protein [Streptomyces sp. NBC_00237]|uniref:nuclear transport factor 2 family protein n=1 Tax=Streptomyces sp. NBC_00237 TaxID=2975687 RepID=UPI0022535871|nr:nuclear transport factor 2 family protein [Streptomyces sp. NBC_00237]MCX5205684.1 nuclear transport factor 2 family protein [Streptomyces sp. NBC_00237]
MADAAENKKRVLEFCRMLFEPGRAQEATDTYLSPAYVQHNPGVEDGPGPLAQFAAGMVATFPEVRWELQRAIAEDDLVAVHWHMTTGPQDRGTAVVEIFRLLDGLVVEHWDVMQPVPDTSANDHPMF